MRLRFVIGLSVALSLGSSAAMADPPAANNPSQPKILKAKPKIITTATRRIAIATQPAKSRVVRISIARHPPPLRHLPAQLATSVPPAVKMRTVGAREIGTAAWYGGTYVGRRTTSGDVLDKVHATAAHRSLPLHSLARVTNLSNGRSVIVRVTDRGPVSTSLIIDVSPRAAEELDMTRAGIVPVSIEQVVEIPADAR